MFSPTRGVNLMKAVIFVAGIVLLALTATAPTASAAVTPPAVVCLPVTSLVGGLDGCGAKATQTNLPADCGDSSSRWGVTGAQEGMVSGEHAQVQLWCGDVNDRWCDLDPGHTTCDSGLDYILTGPARCVVDLYVNAQHSYNWGGECYDPADATVVIPTIVHIITNP